MVCNLRCRRHKSTFGEKRVETFRRCVSPPVSCQGSREIVVDPPLVQTRVRVQADREKCSTGTEYSSTLFHERSLIIEMMQGVYAECSIESAGGEGEMLGGGAN